MKEQILPSSFRDPSGFLFKRDGVLYRQINKIYQKDYDHLIESGLYKILVDQQLLIPHIEVKNFRGADSKAYKIIKPEKIDFISYPYEWTFSGLKDAALTTLKIQEIAFEKGMILKDSSAYNIQFRFGKPILIDSLSFKKYTKGEPWPAYKQFCQHFLAPLALMEHTDARLNQLLRVYIDGIPLDLACSLLPGKCRFSLSLLTHIFMHSKSQKHYSDRKIKKSKLSISENSFKGLIDNLRSTIEKLNWRESKTEWGDYYNITNYSTQAFNKKKKIIEKILDREKPKNVWDMGANDGEFSRLVCNKNIPTIAFDIDFVAVEKNYLRCKEENERMMLPLLCDLTNLSPAIGWANEERLSLMERAPADMAFALALIHHLAISNNLPFAKIAKFFSQICSDLIIEFVPKGDSQVKKLLTTREDIFVSYNQQEFEKEFSSFFLIKESHKIKGSKRILYYMKSHK